VVKISYVQEG